MVFHHDGYGDDCDVDDGYGGSDGDSDDDDDAAFQGCCDIADEPQYCNKKYFHAGIYFCLNDRGLPTGEAFIEMETPQVVVLTF